MSEGVPVPPEDDPRERLREHLASLYPDGDIPDSAWPPGSHEEGPGEDEATPE
ncbi:hypothetical protein acdb102_35010 [Acidothermaceae bacterium B102]|nr:hypothetical protein acdb102_35010 [Acidothermaceae bacterium B102]